MLLKGIYHLKFYVARGLVDQTLIVMLVAIWKCASANLVLLEILILVANLKEAHAHQTYVDHKLSAKLTLMGNHCACALKEASVTLMELTVAILENVKLTMNVN